MMKQLPASLRTFLISQMSVSNLETVVILFYLQLKSNKKLCMIYRIASLVITGDLTESHCRKLLII